MRLKLLYLSVTLLAVACSPKSADTTRIVGQFKEDAPQTVRFVRGYYDGSLESNAFVSSFDTTVAVVNGQFEVEIPKYVVMPTDFESGSIHIPILSDGTTITIDPESGTAVSSDENGHHSQYMDFGKRWNDYQAMMAGFDDEDAREKYRNENYGTLIEYTKEVARNNPDNYNGLNALEILHFSSLGQGAESDPVEILSLLNGLSDEMKTSPMSSMMFSELYNIYNGRVNTVEGKTFVDFTVVQDPENPETSTVKFSDYIGRGKYVLVDFWASWCSHCLAEMPNLVNVYNTYHGDRFDMLSVAVMDDVENTLAAAKEHGVVWDQIVNAQQIPGNAYGFNAIPLTILFGPDGTILKRDLRGDQVGAAVKEALGL